MIQSLLRSDGRTSACLGHNHALARQVGGSVAIAVLVTILARESAIHQTELASRITLSSPPVADFVRGDGGERSAKPGRDLNRIVERQAAVLAYADTARAVAMISLVLAPLALILKRPKSMAVAGE